MTRKIVEASAACAYGAKLCRPGVIPVYPITPQTHIPEKIADLVYDGEMECELIDVESEHSAISAAIGAQATGTRTFTATASQGLALMHEILFIAAGMRMPIVMAVANRSLSAPINIWNDHQDSISERDSGWIQLYCESSQEVVDTIIQAYKIGEDRKVLLPVMVCLDGFTLSHVYEPTDIPEQPEVDNWLPKYQGLYILDPKKPVSMGPVAFPNSYMEFRLELQKAVENSLPVIRSVHEDFKRTFKRGYGDGLIETYRLEDAQTAVVCMGTCAGTARIVVDELRAQGQKVGLIRLRCYRPFPVKALRDATKNLKGLAVIDRNVSLGFEGAVHTDIKAALYGKSNIAVSGFVAGLGGRDITKEHIKRALQDIGKQESTEWLC